ncbi:hypothetical protein HRbin27_01850 [bacterium HR27]|nr:hypothetical protein HRbin27_01850 [bacterium HR27]
MPSDDRFDHLPRPLGVGDIAREDERLATLLGNLVDRGPGVLFVEVIHRDDGTFASEHTGDSGSTTAHFSAAGTGHEGNQPCQSSHRLLHHANAASGLFRAPGTTDTAPSIGIAAPVM